MTRPVETINRWEAGKPSRMRTAWVSKRRLIPIDWKSRRTVEEKEVGFCGEMGAGVATGVGRMTCLLVARLEDEGWAIVYQIGNFRCTQ